MPSKTGAWFCETCDRAVDGRTFLSEHIGHDLTHFGLEELSRALREFLPTLKRELQQ